MVPAIAAGPTGWARPAAVSSPPPSSASPAAVAVTRPGRRPSRSNAAALGSKPGPPKVPNSFCAACAGRAPPRRGGGPPAGRQPEPIECGGCRLDAVPTEGAEQLLRAVCGEVAPEHGPASQQRDVSYAHRQQPRPSRPVVPDEYRVPERNQDSLRCSGPTNTKPASAPRASLARGVGVPGGKGGKGGKGGPVSYRGLTPSRHDKYST